ncbi:MAG: hypothetical protein CBC06_001350 [bacterium TMED46]|nr:MAG: hypothetical protein CBC06_001350 [bacterium TMED46]
MKKIDPTQYNLFSRVDLRQGKSNDIYIVINRKSRIIMKDGIKILEMVKKINKVDRNKRVSVLTSAPVCSKTKQFLLDNNTSIDTF